MRHRDAPHSTALVKICLHWVPTSPISHPTNLCGFQNLPPHSQVMSFRSSAFRCLAAVVLLTLPVTQALRPFQAQTQIITKIDETPHNGSVVPGVSPVKYHNDPGNDLFRIESLDMYPNTCVMYVLSPAFQLNHPTSFRISIITKNQKMEHRDVRKIIKMKKQRHEKEPHPLSDPSPF